MINWERLSRTYALLIAVLEFPILFLSPCSATFGSKVSV